MSRDVLPAPRRRPPRGAGVALPAPGRDRLGARALVAVVVGAVLLGAVALRLVYGGGTIGFDAMWALVWGRELAGLGPVGLDAVGAPTPHPLAIVVSAPVSLLGDAGIDVMLALSWVAFASVGALAFALGRALYSPWVGAVFAALLLTRPQLVLETQQALLDVPFLALALGALLATVTRGREGWTAPLLLAAAGLLRPEAWLLALAWTAWAAPERSPRDRVWLVAIALAAPVLWAAQDLAATGDPLFSLHATRDLAAQLARPRGLEDAVRLAPASLRATLTEPVVWLGLAGAAISLVRLESATFLPAAVAGLGLVTFLVLGVAGLPVLTRYLLLPATLLALWCAVAAAGFTIPATRGELPWRIGGAVVLAILVATLPSQLDELRAARGVAAARGPVADDLERILALGATRAALTRCGGRLSVPDSRPRPLSAYVLDRPPATIAVGAGGVTLAYASSDARDAYAIGSAFLAPPRGPSRVAANRSWVASTTGC